MSEPDQESPAPAPVDVTVAEPAIWRPHGWKVALSGVLVAIVVAGLGAGVGWLWAAITPRMPAVRSDHGFLYASDEPEQPIAADGYFLFIGIGVGILIAVLAWILLRRYRGVVILLGLAVGSLVGAGFAVWVGYKIGHSQLLEIGKSTPVGVTTNVPVGLSVTELDPNHLWPPKPTGVVAGQALAAAFVYTALAGFSAYTDLGRHRRRSAVAPAPFEPLTPPAPTPEPPAA